jgi:hypothetical protein
MRDGSTVHRGLFLAALVIALTMAWIGTEIRTSDAGTRGSEQQGVEVPPDLVLGLPINLVYVHLEQSTGNPERDEELKQRAADEGLAAGLTQGAQFNKFVTEFAVTRVGRIPAVQAVRYGTYQAGTEADRLVIVLFVTPRGEGAEAAKPPAGMLPSGSYRDFPTIYQSERTKLTFILNGGVGVYSDTHPWFGKGDIFLRGSPIADHPAGPGTTVDAEAYLEVGAGGITQIGDLPLYPYAAVTYLESWSSGQDIYNEGMRTWGQFGQAYAGFIYDLPGEKHVLNVSWGRQSYQLRDGFIVSKIPGSNNLSGRGAVNLGPRTAYDTAGVGRLRFGQFSVEGMFLEPDELTRTKTDTLLVGVNLQYSFAAGFEPAFAYFYVPRSTKTYFTPGGGRFAREGLRTFNPALTIKPLLGVDGLWIKGEYAYQNNEDFDMAAYAWYGWTGYEARSLPWRPSVTYRYAFFSGDNPRTRTYERFDNLFSGSQDYFVPGLISSKVVTNSNLRSQRVTFAVNPTETLQLKLNYFTHAAVTLNNLGGIGPLQTLASRSLLQELQIDAYWYIGKHLYFQGAASAAKPGQAIKQALGGTANNWYSIQTSLYFFF